MITETMRKPSEERVWMKYYSEEAQNAELPKMKVVDYVIECNKDRMDKPALHYYGQDILWKDLVQRIDECAKAFQALGVKEGEIVSFVSVAVPETIAAVYALNKIGAACNTIDPRMDVDSIRDRIKESGSRFLLVLDVLLPKIQGIIEDLEQEHVIVERLAASLPLVKKVAVKIMKPIDIPKTGQYMVWKDFIRGGKDTELVEAPYVGDALVAITYTGGTTGIPKGVMMTNDSMNSVGQNFRYCDVVREDDDRYLGIIPIFAAYGMVCGMHMPLCMQVALVPIPQFVPTEIGKLVKQYHPNHIISTPVFIELLIGSKEVQDMDLSFLRTLASGGDSMSEGLEQKLNKFRKSHNMKYPLAQGYGMSELSAAAAFCVNRVYKPGSVGIPSLCLNIGIFDPETGEELGYNRNGEVCVTGPSMMKGYFNQPEETALVMRKHDDGKIWIHSGDIGYLDEDGFLFIKGRIKRMITRFDGHKVFPITLEGLITGRKDVHNCAVVGVNDRVHSQGQYPLALVELMPGVDAEKACAEIFKMCDERVEERGKPVAVLAVKALPMTNMGKVDNRKLEKQFATFDYTSWKPGE